MYAYSVIVLLTFIWIDRIPIIVPTSAPNTKYNTNMHNDRSNDKYKGIEKWLVKNNQTLLTLCDKTSVD